MFYFRFLRHWNRGDYNSCCRTDLTFKPVPESKLSRKREERTRRQAEKERDERDKSHSVIISIFYFILNLTEILLEKKFK